MALRTATDLIRRAMFTTLRSSFEHQHVRGLTQDPTFTQNPQRSTPEPYIYMHSIGEVEVDHTFENASLEYQLRVEAVVRYRSLRGGEAQAQEIISECKRILRTFNTYPSLVDDGYYIYKTTTGDTTTLNFKEKGANYVKVVMPLFVTARFSGLPQSRQPVQLAMFTYQAFMFPPTGTDRVLEFQDMGEIIGAPVENYPRSNGWRPTAVRYSLDPTSDGTITGSTITVASGDSNIRIVTDIDYEFISDTSITTTLEVTDLFTRERSLRIGVISTTAPDVSVINTDILHGTLSPDGYDATWNVGADQRPYIAYDASRNNLTSIDQIGFAAELLPLFTRTTSNGFTIYTLTNSFISAAELRATLQN